MLSPRGMKLLRDSVRYPAKIALLLLLPFVLCCGLLSFFIFSATATGPTKAASRHTRAADDFDRPDGPLGRAWTDMTGHGLVISSRAVTGTDTDGNSGDLRTKEVYAGDQYSQVEITRIRLTGTQWIGPVVRGQHRGRDGYVGIYYWDNGRPELMLFKRSAGTWTQLGRSYKSGPLPDRTRLRLEAVGNTLAFLLDGVQVITATDNSLTGGNPGIMANGTASAGNWSGGDAGFGVTYASTASGIATYNVVSSDNGYGAQELRVLRPTSPAAGVAHNFLIVLPVEAGTGSTFGDGLATLQALHAENQYDLTIIEPTFSIDPWYANNATIWNLRYEAFITQQLVPWIRQNLATTGNEQIWLVGFSKSGYGAQDLILKHPHLFTLAASWDFPADMSSYDQYSGAASSYGTDANFRANYQLTSTFVADHAAPFRRSNRIWIGGYSLYQTDVSDYDHLLTAAGIAHTAETPAEMAHRWDSGWLPIALAALYQDSTTLP